MSDDRQRSIILLVLTAVLWRTSGLFVKIIPWQRKDHPLATVSHFGNARFICNPSIHQLFEKHPH